MKIGTIELQKTAALAPMAGVGDRAFREICKRFGATYLVSEMVSSKGMHYSSVKSEALLELGLVEHPAGVQIFGCDPKIMANAALTALKYNPNVIDINMGCPAPKISRGGGGSALMKQPMLAGEIIKEVVNAVQIPVTVKFRKGWDEDTINAVEFAKIAEQNGASALTIHGRTREQMYAPPVDLSIIKKVKDAVSIPVIGNGDIIDVESAIAMYKETGCDLIMIGRAAIGNPWIFSQIKAYLLNGEHIDTPSIVEKMGIMCEHAKLACLYKGEEIAMREMRKHCVAYLKGFSGAADFRKRSGQISTLQDIEQLAQEVVCKNNA